MANPIGNLGTIPTLTVGGRVFTDLTTIIILGGYCGGSSAQKTTARKANGTAGYAVTSGKTLTHYAYRGTALQYTSSVGSSGLHKLSYSTNDVGMAGNTSFSGQVYMFGDATASGVGSAIAAASVNGVYESALNFAVPQNDYTGMESSSTSAPAGFLLYGYEA